MKYAFEIGLSTMMYIHRYVKISSGIQKLMRGGGGDMQTHSMVTAKACFNFFI
jgi:hypothetical protein